MRWYCWMPLLLPLQQSIFLRHENILLDFSWAVFCWLVHLCVGERPGLSDELLDSTDPQPRAGAGGWHFQFSGRRTQDGAILT